VRFHTRRITDEISTDRLIAFMYSYGDRGLCKGEVKEKEQLEIELKW